MALDDSDLIVQAGFWCIGYPIAKDANLTP